MHVARAQGCGVLYTAHDFHLLCANGRAITDGGRLCLGGTGSFRPDCSECVGRDRVAASERRRYHVDMLRRAQRVICPTQFTADVLRRNGLGQLEQLEVLAPGVAAVETGLRTREAGAPLRVGFVGQIHPAQGVHLLVDALDRVRDVALELHVYGEPEGPPEYAAKLRACADPRVRFHGRFEPGAASRLFSGLDVLAMPSLWYESAPLALAEAFAHGVPVIATKLGGMAESVRDGADGLLVARDDPQALASALRRLATEPGLLERLAQGIAAVPAIAATAERVEQLYVACRA
jgi:glycosyltransferase involved in cell wall biosynthesis